MIYDFLFYFFNRILPLLYPIGVDSQTALPAVGGNSLRALGRDTTALLSDLTQGASNWIQSFLQPMWPTSGAYSRASRHRESTSRDTHGNLKRTSPLHSQCYLDYPEGFEPLRSECHAVVQPTSCPIIRNPFVSPLLAPDSLLRGLPPVHLVVRDTTCAFPFFVNNTASVIFEGIVPVV